MLNIIKDNTKIFTKIFTKAILKIIDLHTEQHTLKKPRQQDKGRKGGGGDGSFPTENLVPFGTVTASQQLRPPFWYNLQKSAGDHPPRRGTPGDGRQMRIPTVDERAGGGPGQQQARAQRISRQDLGEGTPQHHHRP